MSEEQQSQPQSNEDDQSAASRKKLLIVGASIAAFIVILVAVILILVFTLGRSSCQPVDIRPNIDLTEIKAIPSQDDQALVRFAGYLIVKQLHPDSFDDIKYLELKLQKVRRFVQDDGSILVRLETDCAIFDIQVWIVGLEKNFYHVSGYTIRPSKSSPAFGICSVENIYEFSTSKYYSCRKERALFCKTSSTPVDRSVSGKLDSSLRAAGVKILMLDLELNGDPISIESGNFDLIPEYC